MKPTQIAQTYKTLYEQHGTLQKTATAANTSISKISRHLTLLDLPTDIQSMVDAGELPVNAPVQALEKKKNKGKRKTTIKPLHYEILGHLLHCRFATALQISQYIGKSLSNTRIDISILLSMNLIDVNNEFRPFAFSLSAKGCDFMQIGKPKHFISASAIHQRLLRNQIEIDMRVKNPSVLFINRITCWEMGLFPSVAEHLVQFEHNGKQHFALILIDDYIMSSTRILRSITRKHDQYKDKVSGKHILRWADIADLVIVYTIDNQQKNKHQRTITKNKKNYPIKTLVRTTNAIWDFV